MKTQATSEKPTARRKRGETRGRPRIYSAAGRCQPRVALDAGEYLLFERAAKKVKKSVPFVIATAARFGFVRAFEHLAGQPKMEEPT